MYKLMKECMVIGLESKGFVLDFEAKSDIESGFECNIFSDGERIVIITGERGSSEACDCHAEIVYKHYCCHIGDDLYLKRFLEAEVFKGNPSLLTGEYRGLCFQLIDKVKSYGTKNAELLVRRLKNDNSLRAHGKSNPCQKGENVIDLFAYRRSRAIGQPKIQPRPGRNRRPCHMN